MLDPSIARQLKSQGSYSSGFEGQSKFKWKLLSFCSFTSICKIRGRARILWQRKYFTGFFWHILSISWAICSIWKQLCQNFQKLVNMFLIFNLTHFNFYVWNSNLLSQVQQICMCCLYFSFLWLKSLNVWQSCSVLLYVRYCTIRYIQIYTVRAQYIKTVYSMLTKLFDWCTNMFSFATLSDNANC